MSNYEPSLGDASEFEKYFQGNKTHFGEYIPASETAEGVKVEGVAKTIRGQLGITSYVDHLAGRIGLGVVPVYNDQWVTFSVIDVDSYDGSHAPEIIKMVANYGLPFLPFRSKSGGLHLYIFYTTPVLAQESRDILNEYLIIFNLPKKTEIFPKQSVIKSDGIGNWINLPYFGGDDTSRYLIQVDNEGVVTKERTPLMKALLRIANSRYTAKQARDILGGLPIADGPPCLQHITMQGKLAEGAGNNFFFSLARYWKLKDEAELENQLASANVQLAQPMEERTLQATINSAKKTDASYLCKQEPLLSVCKRHVCITREFGIEHVDVSNFSFGKLLRMDADPPYYIWEIDGAKLEFFSEEDLISQRVFQKLCVLKLRKVPRMLKEFAWLKILNNALDNMEVIKIDREDDFSDGSLFMEFLTEFLEYRNKAIDKMQIIQGAVYKDNEKHVYLFKPKLLHHFLINNKGFRTYGKNEMQAKLRSIGAGPERIYLGPDAGQDRVWSLPILAVANYIQGKPQDIDFKVQTEKLIKDF